MSSKKGKPPRGSVRGRKCETRYCRNAKPLRPSGYVLKVCWKCRSRRYRKLHPESAALNSVRLSAKRRNIPFTLTIEQFKLFCQASGYLETKGNKPQSMTIDRINHNLGYSIDNIRVLSHAENSRNGHSVPGMDDLPQNSRRRNVWQEAVNAPF